MGGGHQLRPKTCGRLTLDASVHGQKVRTNFPGSPYEPSNLLSISQLTDSGSTIVMTRSGASVTAEDGTVTLTATRMNGFYIVNRWSPGTVGTPLPAFPSFSITLHSTFGINASDTSANKAYNKSSPCQQGCDRPRLVDSVTSVHKARQQKYRTRAEFARERTHLRASMAILGGKASIPGYDGSL